MEEQDNKRPLDEVMLAMDVVDTLRHQDILLKRELHAEDRDSKMIERMQKIYASQGIDVPDHVLKEGVAALKEERFVYRPPRRGISTVLARIYISRGKWAKRISMVALGVVLLWGSFQYFIVGADERSRARLSQELTSQRDAVLQLVKIDAAKNRAEAHYDIGMTSLQTGEIKQADSAVQSLKNLRARLEQEYEIRVVSRPDEYSAVWRIPDLNPAARNYYVIVEAIASDGSTLKLPITSEEDGKTRDVDTWALRVDKDVYQRISDDKKDDGIIQNRRFGVKRRGFLKPEYFMSSTGAAITKW